MENTVRRIIEKAEKDRFKYGLYSDAFEGIKLVYQKDKGLGVKLNNLLRDAILKAGAESRDLSFLRHVENVRMETYHLEARDFFDSYLIYLEWHRPAKKKYYLPRRHIIKPVIDGMQDLMDGKMKFLAVSLPTRVGKTTAGIFFMSLLMGRNPQTANVMTGYSKTLTDGFFARNRAVITDTSKYQWANVFPEQKIAAVSLERTSIDIGEVKEYPTLTCRSLEGTSTGAIEVGEGGLLYSDDLVSGIEEAMSGERLDKRYKTYLNEMLDRCKDNTKQLMIGTRWSPYDPMGRILEENKDDPDYRLINIPALNEKDESNFVYDYGVGFSTKHFHGMRNSLDPADWWAKYMGEPYVREGLLFPLDELKFFDELPLGKPSRVVAVIDVAWGGGDYLSMPIAYVYDGIEEEGQPAIYIEDVVFTKGGKDITYPKVTGAIMRHNPYFVQVEANNGGNEFRDEVNRILLKSNFHTNVTARRSPPTSAKYQRIARYAPDIKKFYFRSRRTQTQEYKDFMKNLTNYLFGGKSKHEDAPDSLAMIVPAIFNTYGEVVIMERPF